MAINRDLCCILAFFPSYGWHAGMQADPERPFRLAGMILPAVRRQQEGMMPQNSRARAFATRPRHPERSFRVMESPFRLNAGPLRAAIEESAASCAVATAMGGTVLCCQLAWHHPFVKEQLLLRHKPQNQAEDPCRQAAGRTSARWPPLLANCLQAKAL